MTVVEIAVAMVIFAVASGMLIQVMSSSRVARRLGRESQIATNAAQNMMEEIRNTPFRDIVGQHDRDPFNDLGGPGTAEGWTFHVEGLDPIAASPDGTVGEIVLPVANMGSDVLPNWQVREDIDEPLLGLPRDLNGDALVDALDHSDDYTLLPLIVIVRWNGVRGNRELRFFSSMTEFARETP